MPITILIIPNIEIGMRALCEWSSESVTKHLCTGMGRGLSTPSAKRGASCGRSSQVSGVLQMTQCVFPIHNGHLYAI